MRKDLRKINNITREELASRLEAFVERHNALRRPIHYTAHFKVPDGPAYACLLYLCPSTRRVLSYRFAPEPVH